MEISTATNELNLNDQVDKNPSEIKDLSALIEVIEEELQAETAAPLWKKAKIEAALKNYAGSMDELSRYALFDEHKNYTRNLIATDNETYSLMLICWNKEKFSPIHDHPCDGCWVKVIAGTVQEVRYKEKDGRMVETENIVVDSGVLYMHDSMGYHKVGNPSDSIDAMTLHLYCPPFEKCRLWLDETKADKFSEGVSCFYSEYGERIKYGK